MKSVVFEEYGSPEVLRIDETTKPTPNDNEVLIKINASTVTAVDSIFRSGEHFFARLATGIKRPKNKVLGTEFSGVVEKVGNEVTSFKTGDEVFGASDEKMATHAEYKVIDEQEAFINKPDNISFEEAAAVPAGALTALPFLRDSGKIKEGQKVLIIGASGSIGTYAVQFAKYFGTHVTGICSTSSVELVKSLGADEVIDYTKEDFRKNSVVYDIIFDTVGAHSFSKVKNSLAKNGIYLTTVVSFTILRHMITTSIFGSKKAQIAFTGLRKAEDKKKDLLFLKELLQTNKLKVIIDRTFPLDTIAEAHAYVDKGHKKGNVVITMENNIEEPLIPNEE